MTSNSDPHGTGIEGRPHRAAPQARKRRTRRRRKGARRFGVPKPTMTIRTSFLTGVVVAAPIAITIYLTWTFITFVDSQVAWLVSLVNQQYVPRDFLPFTIPGIGVLLVFIALTLLGAFTANALGRWVIRQGQKILHRMPVVRNVYGALNQIFETVISQSDRSFQEVALVEYPRRGIWAIAFVTTGAKGEIAARADQELISLFLPTTPNPTSGFLLFAPKEDVVILDMTVEEGAKMVISGGLVVPEHRAKADQALDEAGKTQGHLPDEHDDDRPGAVRMG